ncbi:MAG TPA: hypothetical protein VKV73_28470 [Chloroflexota bacterium]|nr:hypothetical protein [Chloroflexota bacterium]
MLRAQVRDIHRALDQGLIASLRSLATAAPLDEPLVVALYVHAATVEDVTIQSLLRRVAPVYTTHWAGKGPARYSMADLAPMLAYAQQVFAATEAYLDGLGPDEVNAQVDLERLGQGKPTVAWIVSKFVVLQLCKIYGELASASRSSVRRSGRL